MSEFIIKSGARRSSHDELAAMLGELPVANYLGEIVPLVDEYGEEMSGFVVILPNGHKIAVFL